ncbi:MAG: tRNA guanosine(34) transglycosylase Tgt [Chitinophagales bacterium]|nr:tRNA guanosine(34) transglycosylase Tgt [Chitinophagales bacterium]HAE14163.1 tRNA guanosine(34) transglycosylase Tgt [Bacteroidota bacterium]HAE34695.1 tRNA guanosine(34) transglycosylase Tgt [Bacteroidota bacterium]HPE98214.1 tRNA guanosine(34) transglycosylase Tgt [Chitinophagales bacterium]HQU40026.1 tRNA guanosine(34) transglycosylase Tgt [Chitinophagales bacterium]
MFFQLQSTDPGGKARAGLIKTSHGEIETPIFMPVGTAGTVKAVHFDALKDSIDASIILGNTYHLYLRPGTGLLQQAGGLHRFINWNRPILTDSGGYQVYSLAQMRKILDDGVRFQSHIDGSRHHFTPAGVMQIQREIGADIVMAFDECPPYPSDRKYAEKSMHLTHRWLDACVQTMQETEPLYGYDQYLFPIVQGSTYEDLRKQSAEYIANSDCPGNAIGGLSVGEPHDMLYGMTETVCQILPESKPRYLMGVGTPENLLECIHLGIDMFDCVMPTRNARNGMLFTREGIINIRNKKWENDLDPIDTDATTEVSRQHSKAYLRHLFVSGEMLGPMIASIHNLGFYLWLVRAAREQIVAGTFSSWKNKMVKKVSTRL